MILVRMHVLHFVEEDESHRPSLQGDKENALLCCNIPSYILDVNTNATIVLQSQPSSVTHNNLITSTRLPWVPTL